ncbi:MAG: DUF3307 domain-containing protein [bacterium]
MLIFWRFFLSHLLADFTFQFDYINRWKRTNIWGMLVHCATHMVLSTILLFPFLNSTWVDTGFVKLQGWSCILIMGILHLAEDEWRIFTMRRFKTADGTISFLWDQVIHIGVMFLLSPIYWKEGACSYFPEKWVILLCLLVGVTHALTVFLYFLEKDIYGANFPGFDEKYLNMVERFVLWAFFLLPGWWWLPFMILWMGHMHYLRKKRIIDFSHAGVYVGILLTFFLGILARRTYFG